jgi:very-short-patch-repair endonuclease
MTKGNINLLLTARRTRSAPSARSLRGEGWGEGQRGIVRGPDKRKVRVERGLRRQATEAETKLWFALRDRRLGGFKFVRQEAIGSYIVDFVCREKRLIVEVDGGQHSENRRDLTRDCALAADGYHVLRFWNSDVLGNRDGVLSVILAKLENTDT